LLPATRWAEAKGHKSGLSAEAAALET
jgi:hypothetical protein